MSKNLWYYKESYPLPVNSSQKYITDYLNWKWTSNKMKIVVSNIALFVARLFGANAVKRSRPNPKVIEIFNRK